MNPEDHEHEWETVGVLGDVINWIFIEECTIEDCGEWKKREP